MKLTQNNFNLQQRFFLFILPVIAIILVIANIINFQQAKSGNQILTQEARELYKKQIFAFIVTDKGKLLKYSAFESTNNTLENINNLDQTDNNLKRKLEERNSFQFNATLGDKKYLIYMKPVTDPKGLDFVYLGQAFPKKQILPSGSKNKSFIWFS